MIWCVNALTRYRLSHPSNCLSLKVLLLIAAPWDSFLVWPLDSFDRGANSKAKKSNQCKWTTNQWIMDHECHSKWFRKRNRKRKRKRKRMKWREKTGADNSNFYFSHTACLTERLYLFCSKVSRLSEINNRYVADWRETFDQKDRVSLREVNWKIAKMKMIKCEKLKL